MARGDYKFENIYSEGISDYQIPSESPYLGKKNLIPVGKLGMTTDPRTAAQLAELSNKLNAGTIPVEIGTIQWQEFETIPKQHFEEMRRKAKLAGGKVSVHAPIVGMDPAGFGQQGWDPQEREVIERKLIDVVNKAAIIDPNGNIPITIHPSNTSGSTYKYVLDPETGQTKKVTETLVVVEKNTGKLVPLKEDIKYYPGNEIKKVEFSPEKQLQTINETSWDDALNKVEFQKEAATKVLSRIDPLFEGRFIDILQGHKKLDQLNQGEYEEYKKIVTAKTHIDEAQREVRGAFSKAYQSAKERNNKEELEYLERLSKQYSENLKYDKDGKPSALSMSPTIQSEAIFQMVQGLRIIQPELFQRYEDFAIEKGAETFSNVAAHAYKKYGENAPTICIENLYQGMGFSQGEDLKKIIEETQKKFIEKIKKDGVSESKANQIAKKLIGATFDFGHLNLSRAQGYNEENLIKEAEAIKKHVKHVHITDNFGFSDSHLPIGMGNVPVKALLEALGDEGERARKINEVGGWFQFFKTNPFPEILQAAGSPIYSSGSGPYWHQAGGFQQSYMEGYGKFLPQKNYEMFGAGFSQLPQSLGGSLNTESGSRMGGGNF